MPAGEPRTVDAAAGDDLHAGDRADQRALARAARSEQARHAAALDRERDTRQHPVEPPRTTSRSSISIAELRLGHRRRSYSCPPARRAVRPPAARTLPAMRSADLELDLDVFAGPFDLLLAIVLREEISLLEVELGAVCAAYVSRLEETGELDLEAATEFLVLIAALLELKSRLMLPDARRRSSSTSAPRRRPRSCSRGCSSTGATSPPGAELAARFEAERPYLYRSAPLPPELRRVSVEVARPVYDPDASRRRPRQPAAHAAARRHQPHPADGLARAPARASCATCSAAASRVDFDEAFGSEDRLTQAVTIFALLEMHKKGEATWTPAARRSGRSRSVAGEVAEGGRPHELGRRSRPDDRGAALPLARAGPGRRS